MPTRNTVSKIKLVTYVTLPEHLAIKTAALKEQTSVSDYIRKMVIKGLNVGVQATLEKPPWMIDSPDAPNDFLDEPWPVGSPVIERLEGHNLEDVEDNSLRDHTLPYMLGQRVIWRGPKTHSYGVVTDHKGGQVITVTWDDGKIDDLDLTRPSTRNKLAPDAM